jgi:hypothetical protein
MRKIDPTKFTKIAIDLYGCGLYSLPSSESDGLGQRNFNPRSQKECTAMIRHFVQAPEKEPIAQFMNLFFTQGMAGYAGLCSSLDFRTSVPKPYIKFYPAVCPQRAVTMRVHVGTNRVIDIPPIEEKHTEPFTGQVSYDPEGRLDLASLGPTKRAPLGEQ